MRLLQNGFTTAETTFCASSGAIGGAAGGGTQPVGKGSFHIEKIAFLAGSSVVANTSGGIMFRWGESSDVIESTIVLVGGPTSVGIVGELDGLAIDCNWFEAETNEAGALGYAVFVFGN